MRGSPESSLFQHVPEDSEPVETAAKYLDGFDDLIFVSDICRQKWAPYLKRAARTYYLPNSVDEEEVRAVERVPIEALRRRTGLSDDKLNCVIVGSVQRRKGQDFLFRVLDGMARACPNVAIHVVGVVSKTEGGREIVRSVMSHPQGKRVLFHGHREDALAMVRASDLALFTSRAEAFPRAVAEYMALGKAIISTDVSGIPEMIDDGRDGLLYPADNAGEFLRRFALLAAAEGTRRQLGEQAKRKYFSRFSKAQQVERAVSIIERL